MASSWPIIPMASPVSGLQSDALDLDAENVGQPLTNRLAVREQLGALGKDDAVHIADPPAERTHVGQRAAVSISAESRPRFSGSVSGNIWPMSPSAAAPSRASTKRVRCVGVAVAHGLAVVRNVHAAEPQWPAGL